MPSNDQLANLNQTQYEMYKGLDLSFRLYYELPKENQRAYYSSVTESNDKINRLFISYPILAPSKSSTSTLGKNYSRRRRVARFGAKGMVYMQWMRILFMSESIQAEIAYKCDKCGELFNSPEDAQDHNRMAHSEPLAKKESGSSNMETGTPSEDREIEKAMSDRAI